MTWPGSDSLAVLSSVFVVEVGVNQIDALAIRVEDSHAFFKRVHHGVGVAVAFFGHAGGDETFKEGDEWVVKPLRVDDDHGLGVKAKVGVGDGFAEFFERAKAAGQNEEGVGVVVHDLFTLAHGLGDDELVSLLIGRLDVFHALRDDANDASALGVHGAGHAAHKSGASAAVNKGVACGGQSGSGGIGQGAKGGFAGGG